MKQGDLQQAANAFRDALLKEPAQRYTIQLELVCRAESVAAGLREASQSAGYFILPSPYKGRPCYTACWGLFDSKRQAANALSTVPAFFRGQSGSVPVIAPIRSLLR
jgi:septal ring-binding cell division protein DamX